MLPPPTTMPTSTPRSATPRTCVAISAMRPGSAPYSSVPIRASPDSFRRMRRKTGAVPSRPPSADKPLLLPHREALEAPDHHVLAGLRRDCGTQVLDRPVAVLVLVH